MAEYRFRRISVRIQSVGVGAVCRAADNVIEKLFAQGFKQIVLCLKMRIESSPAYIGGINDLLYRDLHCNFFLIKAC